MLPCSRQILEQTRPRRHDRGTALACGLATTLTMAIVLISAHAGEEEGVDPPVLVARIQTDIVGEATRLWREAVEAAKAKRFAEARAPLVKLIREWAGVLLPNANDQSVRTRPHHFVPAAALANGLLGDLPAEERAWYEAHFQPETVVLLERARAGHDETLTELATRFSSLSPGLTARLVLYEQAAERGDWQSAATHALEWLRVASFRSRADRATVALRYLDATLRAGNEPALHSFRARFKDLLELDVRHGGETAPLDTFVRRSLRAESAREPPPRPDGPDWPVDPESLALRWTHSFDVSRELWDRMPQDPPVLRRGATFAGDHLLVHEGSRVRCLDARSGFQYWTYPKQAVPLNHAAAIRYRDVSLPYRDVTPAGDLVLVLLGDPTATGSYEFLGRTEESDAMGLEQRTRLVALDARTGDMRWATGSATETHPILSSVACGCSSPPLVDGDRIYCTFAHFEGVTSIYGACLDRATGNAHWVTFLGTGESGRSGDPSIRGRFASTHVDAPPFGQRPALQHGQLCFCPHAGFAAGVHATSGTVSWLRALPRYSAQSEWAPDGTSEGASLRNTPLARAGSWVLAPMDSPDVVCVDAGTGDLHWRAPGWADGNGPHHWRNLLSTVTASQGDGRVRLAGDRLYEVRMRDGRVLARDLGTSNPLPFESSHAVDLGRHCVSVAENLLRMERWTIDRSGDPVHWRIATLAPLMGASRADLCISEDRLCVTTPDVVAVYTFRPSVSSGDEGATPQATSEVELDSDPLHAARQLTKAAADVDVDALVRVARRAADSRSGWTETQQASYDAVLVRSMDYCLSELDYLEDQSAALTGLAGLVKHIPLRGTGGIYRDIAIGLLSLEQFEVVLPFLEHWIDIGTAHAVETDGLDDVDGMSWMRGDLYAARLMEETLDSALDLLDSPGRIQRLAFVRARELRVAASLPADLTTMKSPALRDALRRAAGTPSMVRIRKTLLARARAAHDHVEVACLLSDMRLDRPWTLPRTNGDKPSGPSHDEAARNEMYRLAMEEVEALVGAYDFERAENLLIAIELHPEMQHETRVAGNKHERRASFLRGRMYGATDSIPATMDTRSLTMLKPQSVVQDLSADDRVGSRRGILRLWPAETQELNTPEQLRAISPWPLSGPGADPSTFGDAKDGPSSSRKRRTTVAADIVVAQRGLGFELWSLRRAAQEADVDLGDRGWFGSSLRQVDSALPDGGVQVHSVVAREPADRSGVHAGDWVREWNGKPVRTLNGFMSMVARTEPGKTIPVKVIRRGREVLSNFSAGRRPSAQGGLMEEAPLWVGASGRATAAGRTAIHEIDLHTGDVRALWHWVGDGLVRRALVHGSLMFVVINRRLAPDLVLAIDRDARREVWRMETEGNVTDLRPVGSALLVQTVERRAATLLDRWSGLPRMTCRSICQFGYDRAANWIDRLPAAPVAGQVFILAGNRRLPTTLLVNSANGHISWRRVARGGAGAPPMVVAGGFAAMPRSSESIDVILPTLHGGGEPYQETIPFALFASPEDRGGPLDFESRLFARGRTLYVLRLRNRGRQSALFGSTIHLRAPTPSGDRRRPSSLGEAPPQNETAAYAGVAHSWFASSGRLRRYVLSATVGHLGMVVSSATLSSDHHMWHEWLPSREAVGAPPRTVLRAMSRDARRAPVVWSWGRLLVPVDVGLAVVLPEREGNGPDAPNAK